MNVWDLEIEEKKMLAILLGKRVTTLPDWKMFADELGFTMNEIRELESRRKNKRPFVLLCNSLVTHHPTMDLKLIANGWEKALRNDLVRALDDIQTKLGTVEKRESSDCRTTTSKNPVENEDQSLSNTANAAVFYKVSCHF